MVYAARWFGQVRVPGRIVGLLPVGSSLVVTALGVVLLVEALAPSRAEAPLPVH